MVTGTWANTSDNERHSLNDKELDEALLLCSASVVRADPWNKHRESLSGRATARE